MRRRSKAACAVAEQNRYATGAGIGRHEIQLAVAVQIAERERDPGARGVEIERGRRVKVAIPVTKHNERTRRAPMDRCYEIDVTVAVEIADGDLADLISRCE